jgi:hypothetical protein
MAYLLDANVFIAAKNLHYGLDFCPAFWDWLIDRNQAGIVYSIEKVADEIEAGADELSEWTGALDPAFFLTPDPSVIASLAAVSNWATSGRSACATAAAHRRSPDPWRIRRAHRENRRPSVKPEVLPRFP